MIEKLDYSEEFSYPDSVMDYSHKITNALNEDNFFNDEEINPKIFFNRLCESVFNNWVKGEDLQLTEEEMINIITYSAAETVLQFLKEKNVLDSIMEDGEEKFFLTPVEGELLADILLGEKKKQDNKNEE